MRHSFTLAITAGAVSAALLLGALSLQYFWDIPPCPICIWQRWPHFVAIIAVMGFIISDGARGFASLGALAMAVNAGIGLYHSGIERGWWAGPTTCTAQQDPTLGTDALLDQIMNAPVIRCDEIPWEFLGLSLANWNALICAALVGVWLMAWRLG